MNVRWKRKRPTKQFDDNFTVSTFLDDNEPKTQDLNHLYLEPKAIMITVIALTDPCFLN